MGYIYRVEHRHEDKHWNVEALDHKAAVVKIFGDTKIELIGTGHGICIFQVYDEMGDFTVTSEQVAYRETITRVPVQQQGYSTTVVHGAKK